MKRNFFHTDKEKVKFKTNLCYQLPLFCNQLFLSKNYILLPTEKFKTLMEQEVKFNLSQVIQVVNEIAPTFVESAIIIKEHWFLATSFFVFLHDSNNVDDCTNNCINLSGWMMVEKEDSRNNGSTIILRACFSNWLR